MKKLATSLIGAVLLAAASNASAVILTPDVWSPLPGTTALLQPHLAGVALEDESQAFSFSTDGGTISGTVQSRVVRSSVDGTLDFYWRIASDTTSTVPLRAFRLIDFYTPVYDANWRSDGVGEHAPSQAKWFSGGNGAVNFLFDDAATLDMGILPGGSSYFVMLDTNAIAYTRTARYDLTGLAGISDMYDTFAPSAVPEPGSMALLALGVTGLALQRRRRRASSDNTGC